MLTVLLVAGCNGSDGGPGGPDREDSGGPTSTSSTAVPTFTGDPDSEFCRLVRTADDRPVQDPFAPELEPREVELRFRALELRFTEYAEAAPPELEVVLDDLAAALADLGEVLEDHDHDFGRLPAARAEIAIFDDPSFLDAAVRIDAYRTQVCRA